VARASLDGKLNDEEHVLVLGGQDGELQVYGNGIALGVDLARILHRGRLYEIHRLLLLALAIVEELGLYSASFVEVEARRATTELELERDVFDDCVHILLRTVLVNLLLFQRTLLFDKELHGVCRRKKRK